MNQIAIRKEIDESLKIYESIAIVNNGFGKKDFESKIFDFNQDSLNEIFNIIDSTENKYNSFEVCLSQYKETDIKTSLGQLYNNNWINYTKTFIK